MNHFAMNALLSPGRRGGGDQSSEGSHEGFSSQQAIVIARGVAGGRAPGRRGHGGVQQRATHRPRSPATMGVIRWIPFRAGSGACRCSSTPTRSATCWVCRPRPTWARWAGRAPTPSSRTRRLTVDPQLAFNVNATLRASCWPSRATCASWPPARPARPTTPAPPASPQQFGLRAFRRPLDATEVTALMNVYTAGASRTSTPASA